jgi:hypothetical protein
LIFEDTDPHLPLAEMFEASILEFWDLSEDKPWLFVPGTQGRYDWCFAQAFKRSKDFTAILETVPGAEEAGTKRPAPSIATPPTLVKRKKKNCVFAIQQRRAETGATKVQVICPDDETPDLERKIVRLLDAVASNHNVSTLEFQVCSRHPPRRKRARANIFCCRSRFPSGFPVTPLTRLCH